jgi:hypothetical protein
MPRPESEREVAAITRHQHPRLPIFEVIPTQCIQICTQLLYLDICTSRDPSVMVYRGYWTFLLIENQKEK